MKILISAAEASSDAHGAELLRSLRKLHPEEKVEAFGIGGPKLRAEGLQIWTDAREMLAMGFTEALGKVPKLWKILRKVSQQATELQPDVVVVIDYPEFHFKLAHRLRRLGKPLVYYIPPKIWAWRKKRILKLKKLFSKLLVILPFEEKFYATENVQVRYVGNPLVDELPLKLTRSEARAQLKLRPEDSVLLVMPGSRSSELKQHLELFLNASAGAALELSNLGVLKGAERLHVLLPLPATAQVGEVRAKVLAWEQNAKNAKKLRFLKVHISQGNSSLCMVAADAGLIKSGTSTLEAGLLGLPHVIVYKVNWLTQWIFYHLIQYTGPVGLVNLVAGAHGREGPETKEPYVIRELICEKVTLSAVTEEVIRLLINREVREQIQRGLDSLRSKVIHASQKSPSDLAAEEIWSCLSRPAR